MVIVEGMQIELWAELAALFVEHHFLLEKMTNKVWLFRFGHLADIYGDKWSEPVTTRKTTDSIYYQW